MSRVVVTTAPVVVSPARCSGVWVVVTVVVAGLTQALRSTAATLPATLGGPGVDQALVALASVAMLGCGVWVWLVATATMVESWRRGTACTARGGAARRLVLLACGAVAVAGVAGPAAAIDGGASGAPAVGRLAGLPLPERASSPSPARHGGAVAARGTRPVDPPRTAVVRPGDSLWRIAEQRLPPGASAVEIDAAWRRLHSRNREVVGADPDLIHPGQRLVLPAPPGPTGPADRE